MNVLQHLKQLISMLVHRAPGMISCAEFDDFISAYLEQRLPEEQLKIFERHLKLCAACQAYLSDYKKTIVLEKRLLGGPVSAALDDVPEDLITAILAARKARSS